MSARSKVREIWVGLIVIVAVAGLIGLVGLASDGPGFLAPQRTIDVVFRDGQGIRVGSPVRVAGLDTGNVIDLDLVEVEGTLRAARAHLLAREPRQEAQAGREGHHPAGADRHEPRQHRLDRPVERPPGPRPGADHRRGDLVLRPDHRAGRVGARRTQRYPAHDRRARQTIDSVAPRVRQALASIQEVSANFREMSDGIRPAVELTVGQVEDLTRRITLNAPKIELTIVRLENVMEQVQGIVADNRDNVRQSVSSTRDLTASLSDVVSKDRLKVERLLDGMDTMCARSERVLYQADQISGQVANILRAVGPRSSDRSPMSATRPTGRTSWSRRSTRIRSC